MMNTKKLIKMAKKWQQRAALHNGNTASTSRSAAVEKGCFVVYTVDNIRFAFPLRYLSNSVFQELLKIAEEEFGLPTEGPITLPFDLVFLEYLIKLSCKKSSKKSTIIVCSNSQVNKASSIYCSKARALSYGETRKGKYLINRDLVLPLKLLIMHYPARMNMTNHFPF